MNKAELIEKIAKEATLTKVQAGAALDALTDSVIGALKKGDKVTLVGSTIKIKARKAPKFKAGKEFSTKIAKK
jgi:DNA-binding protein HU-beta